MTEPVQQLLLAYFATVRKHAKNGFVAKHQEPFLLFPSPGGAPQSGVWTTISGLHSIELFRTANTPGGKAGQETAVAELKKTERNPFQDQIYVGRADNNDIIFDDASVSKSHAYFKNDNGSWFIFDMESSNGTLVGSAPAKPYQATPVKDGETIRFGDIACKLMLPETFYEFVKSQIEGT